MRAKDGYYIVGTALLQNGPKKMAGPDGAISAVVAAAELTVTVRTKVHFDEVAVAAIYCSRGWNDPHAILQHG